jgi:muramoyltetrapeptide carboxypeptidase
MILGYSHITSLLLAINARIQLITFHGAVATSNWNQFTVDYFPRLLFNAEELTMENTSTNEGRRELITPGKAQGRLIGGNLSVVAAMVGSPYLPSWYHSILCLEDIGEDIYRIDRMLTQFKNAGIINQISGWMFRQCTNCQPSDQQSFTFMQILQQHIKPLNIPAWYGPMIGHIKHHKFTIPVGLEVEIDADNGTLKMLESAVI